VPAAFAASQDSPTKLRAGTLPSRSQWRAREQCLSARRNRRLRAVRLVLACGRGEVCCETGEIIVLFVCRNCGARGGDRARARPGRCERAWRDGRPAGRHRSRRRHGPDFAARLGEVYRRRGLGRGARQGIPVRDRQVAERGDHHGRTAPASA